MRKYILGGFVIFTTLFGAALFTIANAEEIGAIELSSGFMSMTSYTLTIQAFDDPEIEGVTCHVSDVVTGGLGGFLNADPSNASIACRQTGPIVIKGATFGISAFEPVTQLVII